MCQSHNILNPFQNYLKTQSTCFTIFYCVKTETLLAIYIVCHYRKGFNNSKPEQLFSSLGPDCRC